MMAMVISVTNAHRDYRIGRSAIIACVRRVLSVEGRKRADISVVFVDDAFIRSINRRFLSRNAVTDVISFPLDGGRSMEGELYVNLDSAKRQARQFGVRFGNEVSRLVIHGVLHLAGYDDRTRSAARRMKHEEDRHVSFLFPEKEKDT